MTDTSYAFQANFKFGPQYKETLINVPANTPEEMVQKLDWLTANAAKFVAAHTALQSVEQVAPLAANVSNVQVQQTYDTGQPFQQPPAQQQAPAAAVAQWSQPQQDAPPPWSQPATTAPACQHGPRKFYEKKEADGSTAWKAWFCGTPKGTPGQCKPEYVK